MTTPILCHTPECSNIVSESGQLCEKCVGALVPVRLRKLISDAQEAVRESVGESRLAARAAERARVDAFRAQALLDELREALGSFKG